MKTARRIPRKVGADDDEPTSESASETELTVSFVKRPASSKPKKPSHLRTSFAPSGDNAAEDSIQTAPKPTLKRRLLDRGKDSLPHRTAALTDRPSYGADVLAELKSSTPKTSSLTSSVTEATEDNPDVDIAAKFGSSAVAISRDLPTSSSHPDDSYIPSSAEIAEKKERRRRLAKEDEFISLDSAGDFNPDLDRQGGDSDGSDDDGLRSRRQHDSLIIPADEIDIKSKYGESRLVREDEDMAEGFEEFTEDSGKVTLGRQEAKEQERVRRKEIEEQIRAAQHGYGYGAGPSGSEEEEEGEDEVDQEEAARNRAYEAAQTRHGTGAYAANSKRRQEERDAEEREKKRLELPKTKPVPELKVVVARFGEMVRSKKEGIAAKERRLERLEREKEEIVKEEERVKALLKEAGERFEKLEQENAVGTGEPNGMDARGVVLHGDSETLRLAEPTPVKGLSDDDGRRAASNNLDGFAGRRGLSGMSGIPRDEADDY